MYYSFALKWLFVIRRCLKDLSKSNSSSVEHFPFNFSREASPHAVSSVYL